MKLRKLVSMREALASPLYFGTLLAGESWAAWRILLIAIVGEKLTKAERAVFKTLTGREREPGEPVEEFWAVIGRRGGKTRASAVLVAYLATCIDYRGILAPGERGVIPLLAASVQQAANAFAFIEGVFTVSPNLKDLLDGATSDTLSLKTGIDISVRPASFRTIRGFTAIAVIADELAFWRSDDSANPDKEILKALRPSLATTGGPLIGISSPHSKRGELYNTFKRHYGPAGDPLVLVAKAPSRTMNPTLPQRVIDRAVEADPEAASAEYFAEFRGDIDVCFSREAIEACVATEVIVRAPLAGVSYRAFVDSSGGSSDAMTAAIGHSENGKFVLDCVLERRAPFNPDSVVAEFAEVLKEYGVARVVGDRYAGQWPVERFSAYGVQYEPAELTRSELYLALLPLVNSGRVDLLDSPRMVSQFCGLERRTARSGKDSVDHPPGGHDDISNSVAGLIVGLNFDRRPSLVRRADLLKDGEPLPLPIKVMWIYAVLWTDREGGFGVVYAGTGVPGDRPPMPGIPNSSPALFILDFDSGQVSGTIFADILARTKELIARCRAPDATILVPADLFLQAQHVGLPCEEIVADFDPESCVVAVARSVSGGDVKVCAPAMARAQTSPFAASLDFRVGDGGVDDPLRAAAITAIGLGMDSMRGRAAA
jgi:hypothetical protein